MTAVELEQIRRVDDTVRFNPLLVFIFLLAAPYILFFGLLMLVTGETDIALLIEAVWGGAWTVYMKTWVIGTFVLAVGGALFFSGYRTERYLIDRLFRGRRKGGGSVLPHRHYVIESHEEKRSGTRYAGLNDVMNSQRK